MKRFIAIILFILTLFIFIGCDAKTGTTDYGADENYIESFGFEIIDRIGNYGDRKVYLVYDTRTNVEYILIHDEYNHTDSLCPYYDETGNVAIYTGD